MGTTLKELERNRDSNYIIRNTETNYTQSFHRIMLRPLK